jgi:hypothetical protein
MPGRRRVGRLMPTGPRPLADRHLGRRHRPLLLCVPGATPPSLPGAGCRRLGRPRTPVWMSAASTGSHISSPTACASQPMVAHLRSRSWCPARTSPSRCCCLLLVRQRPPSPRAYDTASRRSAQAGTPRQRQLDQLIDQMWVVKSGRGPNPGVHGQRSEAGHGVDLVENHVALLGIKAVHPS